MADQRVRVLIVEDDLETCRVIQAVFGADRYRLELAHDSSSALSVAQTQQPQFILLDLDIPEDDWSTVIPEFKARVRDVAVIVLSQHSGSELVLRSLQIGAEDFISKPFDPALIEISMRNIREKRTLREQVTRLKGELERDHAFGMLVGESRGVVALRECIDQVADTDLNILIRGESGTGKDVTSRLIHQLSSRREGPFVKVNCAALPENLIESELFGYEKGAFTGAVRAKPGRFQLAHGGTIFLDEITEIPFPLQSKLLQVLEQREFVSVGGTRTIRVDSRCIAATNAPIEASMAQLRFREDLYFRLNEFSIVLPPLRERKEDIPLLIEFFLSLYCERYQRKRMDLSRGTILQMMEYPWPGNVRELESLLKRAIVLDSEDIIFQTIGAKPLARPGGSPYSSEIPPQRSSQVAAPPGGLMSYPSGGGFARREENGHSHRASQPEPVAETGSLADGGLKSIVERAVENAERSAILDTLNRTKWNRRKAAKVLGISYSSLLRRIARYNLETD